MGACTGARAYPYTWECASLPSLAWTCAYVWALSWSSFWIKSVPSQDPALVNGESNKSAASSVSSQAFTKGKPWDCSQEAQAAEANLLPFPTLGLYCLFYQPCLFFQLWFLSQTTHHWLLDCGDLQKIPRKSYGKHGLADSSPGALLTS